MSNNSNSNNNGNDQTNNKKGLLTPTVGEAIKEALDTGKEVIVEGPAEANDITDIKNSIANTNELEKADKDIDKGIAMSIDKTNNSKIELNVKDTLAETSLIEDKIILDKDNAEATVATVTTIPADEGVEVEVQTEVEVPVEDKNKDIDSDLKVLVHSPSLSTEVPLISTSQPPTLSIQKERISPSFDAQENQQLYNKASINGYSETIKDLQKQIIQTASVMTESFMDLRKQTIYSYQYAFDTILQNTNNIFKNNQAYCSKIPEIYSKMATTFIENTITMSRMVNDIAFANANTIKKLYNNFQIQYNHDRKN
jgi:hypothetical protein